VVGPADTIGRFAMTPLFSTAAILIIGFSLGYGAREVISQRRRVKARLHRRIFYEGYLAKENRYVVAVPLKAKKEDSIDTAHQITQASRRSIVTHQRGATVVVPSEPTAV
jgi:hypothetical protein